MEGAWRVAAACLAIGGSSAIGGCGNSGPHTDASRAITTASPERAFAPVVLFARAEPFRPMSARWFLERSTFRFAEDEGCPDRQIAVGHTLAEQRTRTIDWIFPGSLGGWRSSAYYRNPEDARCELDFDVRVAANQHTRPHASGQRADGLRPGEGFYLDLVDAARAGPRSLAAAEAYVERRDEGDGQVRLTYWLLYGMHAAAGRGAAAHEGDWERVDVLLGEVGENRYVPRAVQFGVLDDQGAAGVPHDVAWDSLHREASTHPVVRAARGSHTMTPASAASCGGCTTWRSWQRLKTARREPWYGFGGAWGAAGSKGSTTGPLGPHGFWPAGPSCNTVDPPGAAPVTPACRAPAN